jgi:hypothetical protein
VQSHYSHLTRWNAHSAIPVPVLNALHTKWPNALIHVKNTTRNQHGHPYTNLDTRLLSSPQLHSLELTLNGKFNGSLTPRSEYQTFRNCLLQAKNLKRLRLDACSTDDQKTWIESPQHLCLRNDDQFPTLYELGLKYDTYKLTEPHCRLWLKAMDWTRLRILDLSHGCPEYLLAALTGHLPDLKSLTFGFWPRHSGSRSWRCEDLSIVTCFFARIDALQELVLRNYDQEELDNLMHDGEENVTMYWTALKKLHVSFSNPRAKGWGEADISRIAVKCSNIRNLHLKIRMAQTGNDRGWSFWVRT